MATYFHATAQTSKRVEDYQQAARWYRDYLDSFPDDPDSAATNYLLAETLFESKQYTQAASEYERTAYNYPTNDKSATAAYAALVAYQKAEEQVGAAEKAGLHKRMIDSSVKFAQSFPQHPDSAGVLTRADEDIFAAQRSAAGDRGLAHDARPAAAGRCLTNSASPGRSSGVELRSGRLCAG